jgi:hypothetical protein
MHPNLMNLFKALKDPNYVLLKQALGLAAQLPKRLFPKEGENPSTENLQESEIVENEKVLSIKEELNLIFKNAEAEQVILKHFTMHYAP